MFLRYATLLLVTTLVPCLAQSVDPHPITRQEALRRANRAADVLQQSYIAQTGLYTTTGWWNSANAITALTDLMHQTGSRNWLPVLANTLTHAQIVVPREAQVGPLAKMTGAPGFLNDYYDDEGWWALAWIDAYDLTGDTRYLATAESIFADMTTGWDNTCGGGIWWSKDRTYKNAIANELFFSVAAHLANRVPPERSQRNAAWAQRDWEWFQNSGMLNGDHLINDGLTIDKSNGTCRNNGRTTWTYNQGVILGALTEWSHVQQNATTPLKPGSTPNPGTPGSTDALLAARLIADAALIHLTDYAGILHDPCEPQSCGADAPQFKGIFVRNLRALNATLHEPRYKAFLSDNAESVWTTDRTTQDFLGLIWSGPPLAADASTQSSALDLLVSAAAD